MRSASLGASIVRGVAWKAGSTVFTQASRIVVGLLLARLLTPHDFGLAAMALVFTGLIIAFSDLGVGAALVQRPHIDDEDVSTVFWIGAFTGLVLTCVGIAVSGVIAGFYDTPDVKPLFAVLSLAFLISALGTTQSALLQREMNFRALELRTIAGTVAGAATGIPLAALGFGAWAIIAQQLANTAAATALLWMLSPWRPRWTFSLASVRSLGGFSANVFGQRLLYFAHRNVDNLLIGKYIGAAALGAYSLAYNVMLLPFSRIAGPIQQVMFPAFARMQHDREWIARAWARTTRAVAAVCAPALLGLIVVAPDFVDVVLGQKWHETVRLLQILAWVGLLQSLQTMNGDILQALGRAHTFFRLEVLAFCATLLGFILGLHWGVVGVATSYAIATTVLEPLLAFVTARVVGVGFWYVPRALAGVAAASLTMMVVVALTRLALVEAGLGSGLRLGVCILVGVIVYAAACVVAAPAVVADLRNLRRRGTPADAVALTAAAPPG